MSKTVENTESIKKELDAMQCISEKLGELSQDQVFRVLKWAADRHGNFDIVHSKTAILYNEPSFKIDA